MKDIFTEIKSIMKKESRQGYGDNAVFGGFFRYISEQLKDFQEIEAKKILILTKDYDRMPYQERREVLIHSANLLLALEKEVAKKTPSDSQILKEPPPLQYVKSVGPKRVGVLKRLGIYNVEDLISYFPRRHEDRRSVTEIASLVSGENAVIRGRILKTESYSLRKNMALFKAYIQDDSGSVTAVWFNQRWLKDTLKENITVILYGRGDFRYGKRQFIVNEFTVAKDESDQGGFGILPLYALTEGINQKTLRTIVKSGLSLQQGEIPEIFPLEVRQKYRLSGREWAINHFHFPDDLEELSDARRRVVFEEFFLMRLGMGALEGAEQKGIRQEKGDFDEFARLLPFPMTKAQKRSVEEIFHDMASPYQMQRLLEGDVGSGKTVVAAAAVYKSWQSGNQSVLMAPTEILTNQHFQTLQKLFAATDLSIALLTGSTKTEERNRIYQALKDGSLDLAVGTHALIEPKVQWKKLSLVIVDEQHRFGVRQREALVTKSKNADTLALTATPIPRTLAMAVFADMDISVLDEMPPGRQQVKTVVITAKEEQKSLDFIKGQVQKGHQCYILCPLVEDSEILDVASATDLYQRLQHGYFKDISVGLIHGKMKNSEKDEVMKDFRSNKISVLIATTVIEVGVDVPNATVMLIRDAHRFGLAQLHQIRGRIGRGAEQGYCILEYGGGSETAKKRMDIMMQYSDGFKIAEEDLKLRGPGDFFGIRQHGLADLKVADLYIDHEVLAEVSSFATQLLRKNPRLEGDEWQNLRAYLQYKRRMF